MINSGKKITNLQFLMMMIAFITPFGHFIYIKLSYSYAGRDAWIAFVLSTILGAVMVYSQFKSATLSPEQSLVANYAQAFGKWPGKLVAFVYICFFLLASAISLHVFSLFMNHLYLLTPPAALLFGILFVIAYGVYAGSEVLARTIQLTLPLLMVFGLTVSVTMAKERDWLKMLPIMENGFFPVWQGSILFIAMFSELVVFRMLIPNTNHPDKLPKQGLFVIAILLIMFMGPITGPIMIFGEDVAKIMLHPTFEEIRRIKIANFIERIDVLGIFLWVFGTFFRVSIFLLGATKGLAELFHVKKENAFVLPSTMLIFALDLSLKSYTPIKTFHFITFTYSTIAIFFGILLPICMDLIMVMRKKWN